MEAPSPVTDLHEPFRQALAKHLRPATATGAVGTIPSTGSASCSWLGAERLDEHGQAKLRGLLAAGEVHEAWQAKEAPP